MSVHSLALILAALCISLTRMHSVKSEWSPYSRSGKWGFGACPKVAPMKDFDINKFYGQWYLVAHFSDGNLLDRHCTKVLYKDANPGKDICRVEGDRTSVEYDDGEIRNDQFFLMLPNETDHATWIDSFHNAPSKSFVLDTDYDKYLLRHECLQFPRDNPIMYEQHNYITSKTQVWPGGLKDFQKELDYFALFGIDVGPFVWNDQADCQMLSGKL